MEATQGAFSWTALTLFCISALFIHYRIARVGVVARLTTGASASDLWSRLDGADNTRYIAFASFGSFDGMHDVFATERPGVNAPRTSDSDYLDNDLTPRRQASLPASQDLARRPAASEIVRGPNASPLPGEMARYFTCATGPTPDDIAGAGTVTTPEDNARI